MGTLKDIGSTSQEYCWALPRRSAAFPKKVLDPFKAIGGTFQVNVWAHSRESIIL
jgi:hypothetical protein